MIPEELSRTAMLIGEKALARLAAARVAVFGVGGVGSFTVEALARVGVGHLSLIDDDVVARSNINRQLHATTETIGRYKTQLMAERVRAINPLAVITTRETFCMPENTEELLPAEYDYVVDAIDTVSAKLAIVERARLLQIPVISAMGAGNKLDPTQFEIADIFETSVCPLCRVMRRELKRRGIPALKVVYSQEKPHTPHGIPQESAGTHQKRQTPGSISFVPSVAGLILAGEVVRDLCALTESAR